MKLSVSSAELVFGKLSVGLGYRANSAILIAAFFACSSLLVPVSYSVVLACLLISAAAFLPEAAKGRKVSRLEAEIVPFLIRMAKLPKGTPSRAIFERVGAGGPLAELLSEARFAYVKSSGRKTAERIIDETFAPYARQSRYVSVFTEALKVGISHNFEASDFLLKVAREMEESKNLEGKREASLAIQKYTILSAGGFFVPFILGTVGSIVRLFSKLAPSLAGFGISFGGNSEVLGISIFVYSVLIMPALAAVICAGAMEGKPENIPAYLVALGAGALVSFSLAGALLPAGG
jgi:hypothetical protein